MRTPPMDSGNDVVMAAAIPPVGRVKGGVKVDHWGGAKGYQQSER